MEKCLQDIIQNLKDSGCTNKQIQEIIELYKKDKNKVCEILEKHRKELVCNMNKAGKQIDCLDYLLYDIEKNKDKKEEI